MQEQSSIHSKDRGTRTHALEVSVVIPIFNGERFIKTCIDSLLAEQNTNYEIIAVDDHSTDDSWRLLHSLYGTNPRVRIFQQIRRGGAVRCTARGIAESKGPFVFAVGQDSNIHPGWSVSIPAFFHAYPDAAVAQGKILKMGTNQYDYAGDYLSPLGFLVERARGAHDVGQFDNVVPIFSLKGETTILRKSIHHALGGLDETYFFGWEEPEYTWKCWLAGYKTYFLPQVVVEHAYVTEHKAAHYYMYTVNYYYFGAKNNISTLFTHLGTQRLLTILPLNIFCYIALTFLFLIRGEWRKGASLLKGLVWPLMHIDVLIKKRHFIQSLRKISDDELFPIISVQKPLSYFIGKGISYIRGTPY